MNPSPFPENLAVCSWSLQPADPQDLVEQVRQTGIHRIQLALDPLVHSPAIWQDTAAVLQQAGITIISGMLGCAGEDYSTLDTIRETGGIAPDATWEQNLAHIRAVVPLASALGLKLVTFHAGFVPHDPTDPDFVRMLVRLTTVANVFAAADMLVGLETGQETAAELATLLGALRCPNVVVNFDPANMLLYGKGDPIQAIRTLGPWIRQVHVKDAIPSAIPGLWGTEVIVGTGAVDWTGFFAALAAVNFAGDLVIEREAGPTRAADVRTAREWVSKSIRPMETT